MIDFSMARAIERTRDGQPLGAETVAALIHAYTHDDLPDYQVAAWLMAIFWRGLTDGDLTALTVAMAESGAILDLTAFGSNVADKHSTGGVGDKTTLVVAPIVAACGVPVAKMSGRGLGHTGGTIDKLESIAGFDAALSVARFREVLGTCNLVLAGQSADLAPADGKLYALRDVTGTVESIPLIASSVMSKKLAIGAQIILLDVKTGRGAFIQQETGARALAAAMVRIGTLAGRRTVAVLSDMDRPLGRAIGNALEVREAVAALRGGGPPDLRELALHEAATLLVMAGVAPDEHAGMAMATGAITSGAAWEKFAQVVAAQGGDRRMIEDPSLLPAAPIVRTIVAPISGYIADLDPMPLARAACSLGAGRERKGDPIDPAVGIVLHATLGEYVAAGAPLFDLHARTDAQADAETLTALAAYRFSAQPVAVPPLIKETIM